MTPDQPIPLRVDIASERDHSVLERLWTMFRHDMSAFSHALPDLDGGFRQERLDASLRDPDWRCYLIRLGSAPVGLAVVRGIAARERVLSGFFLVHGARGTGNGTAAVQWIIRQHPGAWAVAYQDANKVAAAFWQKIAASTDNDWTLEQVGIPDRPDLPADVWVRFELS
jgi:predicted acetyltransferase